VSKSAVTVASLHINLTLTLPRTRTAPPISITHSEGYIDTCGTQTCCKLGAIVVNLLKPSTALHPTTIDVLVLNVFTESIYNRTVF